MIDAELKSVLTDLVNKFMNILNVGLLTETTFSILRKGYDNGLEEAEKEFNMNFVRDEQRLQTLQKYVFDNIKGMNEDIAEKLRKEITQALLNLESIPKIVERVQKVMDVSIERARIIARTEMNRAENMGHIDAVRQSGLKVMKQWDAHLDARTSPICRALDGKRVGINEKFVYEGEEFDAPPSHPNCRSSLIFIQEDN